MQAPLCKMAKLSNAWWVLRTAHMNPPQLSELFSPMSRDDDKGHCQRMIISQMCVSQ